jgi:regulator of protease activity HflC (stomatin/prohibitin superfamily)
VLFYLFCFVTIAPGHVGVKSWFGQLDPDALPAGPHIVNPLKLVKKVNVQTQKNEEPATVPTKNGLSVGLKATMLYHIRGEDAPKLFSEVSGLPEQIEFKIIDPIFKNAVRDACAGFDPEALYTSEREKVEAKVMAQIEKELSPRGIVIESVMLLDPVLPDVVRHRIEQKVAAEQDAIRMQSVFTQRELEGKANKRVMELEAESKVIQAKGIAEAQTIIKKDLTDEYIRYLWVMALKEHQGAIIYVPTGQDGLPFFHQTQHAPTPKK